MRDFLEKLLELPANHMTALGKQVEKIGAFLIANSDLLFCSTVGLAFVSFLAWLIVKSLTPKRRKFIHDDQWR